MTRSDAELAKLSPAVIAEMNDFMRYCILALEDLGQLNKLKMQQIDPVVAARLRHALRDARCVHQHQHGARSDRRTVRVAGSAVGGGKLRA